VFGAFPEVIIVKYRPTPNDSTAFAY